MTHVLYTYPNNPRAFKALIAAKYNGVQIDVPSSFNMGTENKTPEFRKLNPNGKVPTLKTPDGQGIFESNAIARYVARLGSAQLFGRNAVEGGQVDMWVDWSASEIDLPAGAWIYPIRGYIPNNPAATAQAKTDIRKVLGILNDHLETRTFLVGERVTLADIVLSMSLYGLYATVLDPGFRKQFKHTNRWFLTCVNQPEFSSVIGPFKMAEKMAVAAAAPAAAAAAAAPKAEKKAEKKPKEEPKKEAKPKAAAAAAADDEEDETPKEAKPKSALDLLPPSKFSLDDWKKMYSNNDGRKVAFPWLWENIDTEGFCFYFCNYKYNDECKIVFMTSNLVSGYFSRAERVRKYAFGCMLITGEENVKLSIGGCWLFRGQGIPDVMLEVDDTELYEWKKADPVADRARIEDYFAWDGPSLPPVLDGKTFK